MKIPIGMEQVRWPGTVIAAGLLAGALLGACASQPGTPASPANGGAAGGNTAGGGAAAAAQAHLVLQADTVLGGTNLTKEELSCVQQSQFERNEEIVWRAKVVDPATGKPMDDKTLTSVEVKLPDQTLKMRYAPHPKTNPTDYLWTVSFDVPATYPTGALPYSIVATAKDGRTGTYEQFKVSPALLTITSEIHAIAQSGS